MLLKEQGCFHVYQQLPHCIHCKHCNDCNCHADYCHCDTLSWNGKGMFCFAMVISAIINIIRGSSKMYMLHQLADRATFSAYHPTPSHLYLLNIPFIYIPQLAQSDTLDGQLYESRHVNILWSHANTVVQDMPVWIFAV